MPDGPDTTVVHDLLVVGAGSVGLTMAAVFGQLGRSAIVLEKHSEQYGLPRAGHIDHEVMRLLESLDAEGPTLNDAYATEYYKWINAEGETLLEFPWGEQGVSGWHSDYMQNSALLEASLLARVNADPQLAYCPGWQAVGLTQTEDGVELTVERAVPDPGSPVPRLTGERSTLRGRYLVACDGANSRIRSMLGVERLDLGFNENWLVVDARRKSDFKLPFDSGQICDPRRPTTVLPLGKHHRRWEWHLRPDENPADFASPAVAWRLLGDIGIGPADVEPVRQLVYTFEARLAQRWKVGRVFLAGDAAHTMPPFMGQGMCSGMRDAKNLAWKLDLVLSERAGTELLDSYQQERYPHVYDWTVISLESGKIPCIIDPDQARARDEMFRAGYRPPIPEFPQLVCGVLDVDADGVARAPAGELSVQGRVNSGGRVDLFDRLYPERGFVIVDTTGDPRDRLRPDQVQELANLGASFVFVALAETGNTAFGTDLDAAAIDVDGTYARWFEARGVDVAIVRPDFYVYGAARGTAAFQTLADALLAQLVPRTGASRPTATSPVPS